MLAPDVANMYPHKIPFRRQSFGSSGTAFAAPWSRFPPFGTPHGPPYAAPFRPSVPAAWKSPLPPHCATSALSLRLNLPASALRSRSHGINLPAPGPRNL